jgi:hypothetical protein
MFFWLPLEDTTPISPLFFAGGVILLTAIAGWLRSAETPCVAIWTRYPASGMILGGALPLLAGFLMLFKNGLHGHGFPDFSSSDLVWIASKTPWTILAGSLTGLTASFTRWRTCP